MGWFSSRLLLATLALGTACSGEVPFDTTRTIEDRGTLGEEVFDILQRDYAREDPRRAEGFARARSELVEALDHLIPQGELRSTQVFLQRLLPLHDDGLTSNATDRLAEAALRLEEDAAARGALAALLRRDGYVERRHEDALLRRLSAFPEFRTLANSFVELALSHDGLDARGQRDPTENDAFGRLQQALAERLTQLEFSEDAERAEVLIADLLLSEDERLAEGAPLSMVARDARGLARLAGIGMPGPFVDANPTDGLPDVNALGEFVDAEGRPLAISPFARPNEAGRDALGRAVDPDTGEPLYRYVSLERTLLAGLLREGRTLVSRELTMKAVRSLGAVLGPRDEEGLYSSTANPLLDLAHAAAASVDLAELPDLLELARRILSEHEGSAAWLALELESQVNIAKATSAKLEPGNTFEDEFLSWLRKILREPGLAEAVLEALKSPEVAGLGPAMRKLLEHKAERLTEADFRAERVFVVPVDRERPDLRGNQSLALRLFHLIHDTRGARYEPSFAGIPLGFVFAIDDLAEFYMLSMIGEARVPRRIAQLTGLSERPTPEELAVFINTNQTFGNPRGNEGLEVKENDGDTLFAVSASGMDTALQPLVRAFHDQGQLRLLFEFFELLHLHWASREGGDYQSTQRTAPRYSKLSGLVRFEPMLAELFRQTKTLDAARQLLRETEPLRTARGSSAKQLLLTFARKFFDKDPSLTARDGKREVRVQDQRVTPLSPFDMLRAALESLDRRMTPVRADWDAVTQVVVGVFFEVERIDGTHGRMKNPRSVPMASLILRFLEGRAAAHAEERSRWLKEAALAGLEDTVRSRELPAVLELVSFIDADPRLTRVLRALVDDFLDESRGFGDLLLFFGNSLSAAKDASLGLDWLHFIGYALMPENLKLHSILTLIERSGEFDEEGHLIELLRRGIEARPRGGVFAFGFGTAARQAHRVDALSTAPPDAEDLGRIVGATGRWLLDDEHGMRKFYALVRARMGASD